jgi:hypothetical protein
MLQRKFLSGVAVAVAFMALFSTGCSNVSPFSVSSSDDLSAPIEAVAEAPEIGPVPILVDKGDYYEMGGDIILYKQNETHVGIINELLNPGLAKASGTRYLQVAVWPKGNVPYKLKGFTAAEIKIIRSAMDTIQKYAKVKFTASTASTNDYTYIIEKVKNQSYGGMSTLGYGKYSSCKLNNTIVWGTSAHEFLHGLGLSHEHQRWDRDKYITVYTANAVSQYLSQFALIPQYYSYVDPSTKKTVKVEYTRNLSTYDYESIMHYPSTAFSINGKETIKPKVAGKVIGQRKYLSANDKISIKTIYGAPVK